MLDAASERDREEMEQLNTVQDAAIVSLTPWLRRTGWIHKFSGCNMSTLVQQTGKPKDDAGLKVAWECTAGVLRQAYEGVKDCIDRGWMLIPFWLASAKAREASNRPFRTYFTGETLERYFSLWQRYICFCLQAHLDIESGVEFLEEQSAELDSLHELLETGAPAADIEQQILRASYRLIAHSDYKRERSSLIYFSDVLGYDVERRRWHEPSEYTTILAGIQFCIRVLILEHTVPMEGRDEMYDSLDDPMTRYLEVFLFLMKKIHS